MEQWGQKPEQRTRSFLQGMQTESYVDDAYAPGRAGLLNCALGTNPFGPPPGLAWPQMDAEAMAEYPQPGGQALREALAQYWRPAAALQAEDFAVDSGSFSILERINQLFLDESDRVLGVAPQFSDYIQSVRVYGGVYRAVPLPAQEGCRFNAAALVAQITPADKLIYIDNPNNPTGQAIPLRDIEAVAKAAARAGCCVVVDEAYGDLMPMAQSAIALLGQHENLMVVRSFSKGWGLAGLRVGYLAAPPALMAAYHKVSRPFTVSTPALLLAAEALQHRAHLENTMAQMAERKQQMLAALRKLKAAHTAPGTSILLLEGAPGQDLYRAFLQQGVLASPMRSFCTLGSRHVRLRLPNQGMGTLLSAVAAIEATM